MDVSDVSKMTVTELREELKKRKLATSGVKAQLAERLKSALCSEENLLNNSLTTSPTPVKEAVQTDNGENGDEPNHIEAGQDGSESNVENGAKEEPELEANEDQAKPDNNLNGSSQVQGDRTENLEEDSHNVSAGNEGTGIFSGDNDDELAHGEGIDRREDRQRSSDPDTLDVPQKATLENDAKTEPMNTSDVPASSDIASEQVNVTERKLFIGGLQPRATDSDLEEYFGQFGKIERVLVKMDPVTKRSRGFGFVTFVEKAALTKVLDQEEHVILDRRVDCKQADGRPPATAKGKGPSNPNRKLFIGGIEPESTSDADLREKFSQFGNVAELDWPMDKASGKKRVFCFVQFEKGESIDKALKAGRIKIGNKEVDIKLATPKTQQNNAGNMGGRGNNMGGRGMSSNASGGNSNWNNFGGSGNWGGGMGMGMGMGGPGSWGDWGSAMEWANAAQAYYGAFGGYNPFDQSGNNMMAAFGGGGGNNWQGNGGGNSSRGNNQRSGGGNNNSRSGGGGGAGGGRGRYHPYHRN